METNSIRLNCNNCSKTDPSQILNCSKHPSNCYYRIKKFKLTSSVGKILSIVFFVLGILFIGLASSFAIDVLAMAIPFGGIGLVFTMAGLFLFFGDYILLSASGKSASCIIYKIFGVTVAHKYFSVQEKLPLLTKEIALEYPASILSVKESAENPSISIVFNELKKMIKGNEKEKALVKEHWHNYTRSNNGDEVFISTFISLIAGKVIEIKKSNTEVYILKRKMKSRQEKNSVNYQYLVYPGENHTKKTEGLLETTLINNLLNWQNTLSNLLVENPLAPTIQDLIESVYQNDVDSPKLWICDFVRQDARERGLFFMDMKKYYMKPEYKDKLKLNKEALDTFNDRFKQSHHEFYSILEKEVEEGLRARETSSD